MIKIKYIIAVAAALFVSACGGPRIVPDDELALIFRDVYLTNAFTGQSRLGLDSLNIYEPVFAKYGYTSEDIQFTIGSFAKRKSARLSDDVVEKAIAMLEEESRFYNGRIAMADTVARIARTRFSKVVYTDSVIRARRIADTSRLRISIPAEIGKYDVAYTSFVDSTDRNNVIRTNLYLLDRKGVRQGNISRRLTRSVREKVNVELISDSKDSLLVLDLNGYPQDMTAPRLTVDSLVVTYYPPDSVAIRRMMREWFDFHFVDSLYNGHETHSSPLSADPRGVVAP